MSKDKVPKIMDLVSYGKFKTICNCNGGPYEYINEINYEDAQKAYDALEAKLAECVAALEFYADKNNWNRFEDLGSKPVPLNCFLKPEWAKIVEDSGKLAREVLERMKK